MVVVFSTYQSIDVVSKAQKELGVAFNLIVCDEAHRTTGVTLKGDEDAAFVKVHDDDFIRAHKRLYMTATPRLYRDDTKTKAKEADAYLCSMDDEAIYGPEVYRIGFGEAVDKQLLSDYKVLVLTMNAAQIPESLQKVISDKNEEINTDDAGKLIGCINALSKRMLVDEGLLRASDPLPMRTAVAFCQSIAKSKHITGVFNDYKDVYYDSLTEAERKMVVGVQSDHVDGTMGAGLRDEKLAWLKSVPGGANECRILTNVRCLSEGVDVPSLDAVMFLSARNSEIDVVQSVGRVMRRAAGKQYGYIIIPVVIPADVPVERVMEDNERFKVVWTVLNALRAHDDRFSAMVNKIDLNKRRPDGGGSVIVGCVAPAEASWSGDGNSVGANHHSPHGGSGAKQFILPLGEVRELQNIIYARMVQKVGNKRYWEQWAQDVAKIAQDFIERIGRLIAIEGSKPREAFARFGIELRENINPAVRDDEIIEMLAQHLITKPVFEALFEDHSFVQQNPVSQSLQRMIDLLDDHAFEKDTVCLSRFYESVKQSVAKLDNGEARQKVIIELYDKFFRTAFPKTVEKLGIVYTPVEIVDYINASVAEVLKREFGRSLSDENVHILDPFTGTGTFIVRMIQSGLIDAAALPHKYAHELHTNEIVLLAYYIASINIENAYHEHCQNRINGINGLLGDADYRDTALPCPNSDGINGNDGVGANNYSPLQNGPQTEYTPFPGICLTDSFQLGERTENPELSGFEKMLAKNSERANAQKNTPIMVIVGNPPYSVGQKSANDNAQNQSYPYLESRIAKTYAAGTNATNKNSLYDSYIKAFRWASDRLGENQSGIVAFVSNAGWIDGNAMDGLRQCFEAEFSSIYVFNLRGNCRTSGEVRRKEKDNVFGLGSRTPIAITLLVKKAARPCPSGKCQNMVIDRINGLTGLGDADCRDTALPCPNSDAPVCGTDTATPCPYRGTDTTDAAMPQKAMIYYRDIGDYLTREQKLDIVAKSQHIFTPQMDWMLLEPNEHGDWLNQRDDDFGSFIPLGDKDDKKNGKTFFVPYYSNGLKTQRDTWCYNYSSTYLKQNIRETIDFYNEQREGYQLAKIQKVDLTIDEYKDTTPSKISWTWQLVKDAENNKEAIYIESGFVKSVYRPFCKQNLYYDKLLNERMYQIPKLFPTPLHDNRVICVSGVGVTKEFSCIITDILPDLELIGKSQCFPLYWYEQRDPKQSTLFAGKSGSAYIRRDGVTDFILGECRARVSPKVTKEDIFYFVYGLLHSPEYREKYSADLKKMLPRLPLPEKPGDFWAFSMAGKELAELHVNYENVGAVREPPVQIIGADCRGAHGASVRIVGNNGVGANNYSPLHGENDYPPDADEYAKYRVEKMRFITKGDKTVIQYNPHIRIENIPLAAYDYVVNGRSAIEWIMERYQVKIDKDSGIRNDPNDWAREHGKPRYILDLLLSVMTVSLETVRIVGGLPGLGV